MSDKKTAQPLVAASQIEHDAVFRLGTEGGHCTIVWPSGAFNTGKKYKAISVTPATLAAEALNKYDYDHREFPKMFPLLKGDGRLTVKFSDDTVFSSETGTRTGLSTLDRGTLVDLIVKAVAWQFDDKEGLSFRVLSCRVYPSADAESSDPASVSYVF